MIKPLLVCELCCFGLLLLLAFDDVINVPCEVKLQHVFVVKLGLLSLGELVLGVWTHFGDRHLGGIHETFFTLELLNQSTVYLIHVTIIIIHILLLY